MVVRTVPEINGDGRLAYVYAMADQGTAAVDEYAAQEPRLIEDLAIVNGHYYMAKPPLPAMLILPAYRSLRVALPPANAHSWTWRWLFTLLVSGMALGLVALLVRRITSDLGFDRPDLTAVGVVLGTPLVAYGTYLFDHVLAALLLLALLVVTLRAPRGGLAAGLLLGLLISTDYLPAVGGAVLALYHCSVAARHRLYGEVVRLALGTAAAAVPLLVYLSAVFGSPLANMYRYLADPTYRAAYASPLHPPSPDVAATVVLSPQQGIFVFAPIALFGVLAGIPLLRRCGAPRRAALLSLAASAAMVAALASTPLPYDGSQYGARYLVPLIPLLAWPLATIRARRRLPLILLASVPQVVALSVAEPLLPPEFAFPYAELLRRYVGGALAPSILAAPLDALGLAPADARIAGAAILLVWVLAIPVLVAFAGDGARRAANVQAPSPS